jgi:hypothetical protein
MKCLSRFCLFEIGSLKWHWKPNIKYKNLTVLNIYFVRRTFILYNKIFTRLLKYSRAVMRIKEFIYVAYYAIIGSISLWRITFCYSILYVLHYACQIRYTALRNWIRHFLLKLRISVFNFVFHYADVTLCMMLSEQILVANWATLEWDCRKQNGGPWRRH